MYQNILVAVDINDQNGAVKVSDGAKALGTSSAARMHIVTVFPDSGMAIVGVALDKDHATRALNETKKALQEFAATALPNVAAEDIHVRQGSIYDCIIKTANSIDADLIVVGSHRPELRDYLVGPNAARVARHATQSVLIVR